MPSPTATADEADTLELDRPEGEGDADDGVDQGEEQAQDQSQAGDAADEAEESGATDEAEDGVVVSIGDEPPEEEPEATGTPVIREIRRAQKEAVRALRAKEREAEDLKRQIEELRSGAAPATAGQADPIGQKPKLADFDYDDEKYAEAVESWVSRKTKHEQAQQQRADAERKQREAWESRLADYGKKKAELPVKDFEDAEESVREVLNVTQQGVILSGTDNPALIVYALGKNPKKAKELAAITDPVRFAVAVGKLETQLKVTPRRTAPIPETRVRGSSPGAVTAKLNLEKLRESAHQSGDFSKYLAAKRAAGK